MKARRLLAIIVATTIVLQASALRTSAQAPNVVIQWNQTLQTLFVGTGPGVHLRAVPMMHIAMFDAINSIEDAYTPYLGEVKGSHGASADVAAATEQGGRRRRATSGSLPGRYRTDVRPVDGRSSRRTADVVHK